jgi:hypothetical protein
MKKKILVLIIGVLLAGANAYAGDGDLIVQGKVGIGTATPDTALDVVGYINTDEATGGYQMDGLTVLQANDSDNLTFVGIGAGASNSTGTWNTAIGKDALKDNTVGVSNTALGVYSLESNIGGTHNTAVGVGSLAYNTSGITNVAVGYLALGGISYTGDSNIGIGYRAGDEITSGSNNIIIGNDIDAPSATGDNQLSIGNLIFGTGIDGTDLDISSGNIGIGEKAPTEKLEVTGAVKISDASTSTCDASAGGTIEYNSTAKHFYGCAYHDPGGWDWYQLD